MIKKSFITLSFLLLTLMVQSQKVYDANKILEDAGNQILKSAHDDAISVLKNVHHLDPKYPEAQYLISEAWIANKQVDSAIVVLKKLYLDHRFDDYPQLYTLYGNSLSANKSFDESHKIFSEGFQKYPRYSNLVLNHALMKYSSGNQQEAIDLLKKAIEINPSDGRAHYVMGILAFENGQLTIGALSLITYLSVFPEDDFAAQSIGILNQKLGSQYAKKSNLKWIDKDDNFSELEEILSNNLPLNKSYKLQCDIDENFSRQVQAVFEYAATHEVKTGFFENVHLPWMANIHKSGYTEHIIYLMLSSATEVYGKVLKKNSKMVEKLVSIYHVNNYWPKYCLRDADIFGGKKSKVLYFMEDNNPYLVRAYREESLDGPFATLNQYGQILSQGNSKDGNFDGEIRFYNDKGVMIEKTNYKEGVKNGIHTVYYANGNIKQEVFYVNDTLSGKFTNYNIFGSIDCEGTFKNDYYQGEKKCYFENGALKSTENFLEGVYDGAQTFYYANKIVESTYQYTKGNVEGKVVTRLANGNLVAEYEVSKDQVSTGVLNFHSNGVKNTELIPKGDGFERNAFDFKGRLLDKSNYDKNMNLLSIKYFDENEKMYFEETYSNPNAKLKTAFQYDKSGKAAKVDLNKYVYKNAFGNVQVEASYKNGLLHGPYKVYFMNGKLSNLFHYENGIKNGVVKNYSHVTGNVSYEAFYVKDTLEGLEKSFYDTGELSAEYYYHKGKLNGPFSVYYKNKTTKSTGFYEDDQIAGKMYAYYSTGDLKTIYEYVDGKEIKTTHFLPEGKSFYTIDFMKEGQQRTQTYDAQGKISYNIQKGVFQGAYFETDLSGDTSYVMNFVNGKQDGDYFYYHPSGKKSLALKFISGKQYGISNYYDLKGNIKYQYDFINAVQVGLKKAFYQNGKLLATTENDDQIKNYEKIYYNHDGDTVFIAYYINDFLSMYKTRDAKGVFTAPIILDNKPHLLINKNKAGTKVFEMDVDQNLESGVFKIFNADGTLVYHSQNKSGCLHGQRIEYYHKDKPYRIENFQSNDYEGTTTYYDLDGNKMLEAHFKDDMLHGNFNIYEKGILKKTKIYNSDIQIK